jgi:hypothetical protein
MLVRERDSSTLTIKAFDVHRLDVCRLRFIINRKSDGKTTEARN